MRDLTFYLVNTPSSGAMPRCWHRNIILQTDRSCRSILTTNSVVLVPRAPETRLLRLTDRGWPQRRQRVCPFNVLLLTDTTREHACDRRWIH